MTRVAIAGAGRMGHAIARLAEQHEGLSLTAVWARDSAAAEFPAGTLVSDDLSAVVATADVLIDFSLPAATEQVLDAVVNQDTALVCGVSGLDDSQMAAIDKASRKIPLLYDRNMSQGIAVLDAAIRQVIGSLGDEFTVEIKETHHIHKKDAPSGTALKLGDAIAAVRGQTAAEAIRYVSEREGEVPGDHDVILTSPTERLELRHSVTTRDVFAEGALRAAKWLVSQERGRFSMHDVLFAE